MSVNPGSTKRKGDGYHHCIPRFILRYFARVAVKKGKRKKPPSPNSKGPRPNILFLYELSSGSLQDRSLSRVYGRINLYRDLKNPTNVDHLEKKLAKLEGAACGLIQTIHDGIQTRTFTMTRQELSTLRKFIFLMHYRSDAVSSTYFQANSPSNAPILDWIRTYKESRNLTSSMDLWLDGLRFYLDTPHQKIVEVGEHLRERYGDQQFHDMLRRRLDPEIEENYYAIDYEFLANYFFLGVWEAADNDEFVLGGNTFSLWEGLIQGAPSAHRLCVLSPRIVVVLRRTFLRNGHPNDPAVLHSRLADIPIIPPNITHAKESVFINLDDSEVSSLFLKNIRSSYLSSSWSQQDQFTFGITKLTSAQTYSVNEVIMINANLHPEGSITFHSPIAMLNTLKTYMASQNTFLGGTRSLYQPLLRDVYHIIASSSATTTPVPSSVAAPNTPQCVDRGGDVLLNMLLRLTVMNGISFPSSYNRAYLVFHMVNDIPSLSNPVSSDVRSICEEGISKLRSILDPPLPPIPAAPSSPRSLVETLPKEESEIFFALVGHQIDQIGVWLKNSDDILAKIIYEAGLVGITHWLAANRPDFLTDLLSPQVMILV